MTAYYRTMQDASDIAVNMAASANGATVAIEKIPKASKAAELGLKALSIAGNMIAMWAISKVLQVATEKITELANASEIAEEKATSFANSVNNATKDLSSNFSTLSSLNDEYQKLSKGVNALGENVSLSTDEYGRYKEVVQQISDIMPNMTAYFNAQGEKIAFVKGELSDLNDEYEEYIQKQAKEFLVNGDDDGNTLQDTLDNFANNSQMGFWESLKNTIQNAFGSYDISDLPVDTMISTLENLQNKSREEMIAYLTNVDLDANGEYLQTESNRAKAVAQEILNTTVGDIRKMTDEEFNTLQESIANNIESLENSNDVDMNAITSGLLQAAYSKDDFWAVGEDIRKDITTMLSSINADTWKSLGITEQYELENFVAQLITEISSNKDGVTDAWNGLFSPELETLPVNEYIEKVNSFISTIANVLGLDEEGKKQLMITLGFDVDTNSAMLNGIKEKLDDVGDSWADTLNISDLELVASDEFEQALEKQKDRLNGAALSAEDYAVALQSVKDAQNASDNENGNLWDYSTTITQLDTIKDKFDTLDKTYAKLFDGDKTTKIGFEDLSSINEAFKDVEGIDNYIQKLQEAGQNQEAVTTVMQDLIGAYLDYSGLLDNVTEENADLISQTLSELGVLNSKELVLARLSGELITMSNAEQLATTYGLDLTNITHDEINALIAEGSISAQVGQQLAYFAIQKQVTNDAVISTDGDCQNLINLAKTAGYSESVLTRLEALKKRLADNPIMADSMRKNISNAIKNVFAEAELDAKNINFSLPEVKYNGGSATKSAIDKANKAAEDNKSKFKEILDGYLELYKAELDAGLTDFNTFLNKSRSLLDEYYRDGKISTKDYWDEVKSLYEYQLSIYDKVIKAVTRRYDTEIDKINDTINGIEKQNDLLQKQKDNYDKILSVVDSVYEKQIKSLEDEKQLLQDKIDEINDANSALDLQYRKEQALYELKRAQEQRTKLVFNGDEFVYQTDQTAIRDAQKNLQDIENEEIINKLEKEQAAIDESISKLEEYRDLWREISNAYDTEINQQLAIALWGKDYENIILQNRISDIESFKNNYVSIQKQIDDNQGLIDSYNEKIEYYQALKEQWQSLADEYENSVNDQLAAQILGANWEADILNGRVDVMNNFRNQYISIQQAIADAAWASANAQIAALNAVKAAEATKAPTSGGSSGSVGDTETKKTSTINNDMKRPVVKGNHNGVLAGAGNTMQRYGTGTKDAEPGVHKVGENGKEIVRTNDGNAFVTNGETMYPFEGGEVVIKASETEKILSNMKNLTPLQDYVNPFSGLNLHPIDYSSMVMSNLNLPDFSKLATVNRDNSTSVSIGEIHLHEVQNVDGLANAIIRELPNKTIQAINRR